jgi:hypothetical protein
VRACIRSTLVVVTSCLVISCTTHLPTAPATESSQPEDRGTLLTTTGYGVELVWPKNANTIYYLSGNVMAVDVQTRAVSKIFDVGSGWATSLQLSPDHSWLYFRVAQQYGPADKLYRISTLSPSTPQFVLQPVYGYCIAPDNVHLAYTRDDLDTLHLYDITKGTDVSVPMQATATPFLFSPDGKKVLCRLDVEAYSVDYAVYSLETGQTSALPNFTLHYNDPRLVRWDESGLRIIQVDTSPSRFTLVNYSTGENRPLGQASGNDQGDDFGWSADGKRFAYWDGKILSYRGWGAGVVQYSLRSIILTNNQTELIAVGNTSYDQQDGTYGKIAFSGDSRSVAFVFRCGIYVKSVPE